MRALDKIRLRLRSLLARDNIDRELDDELGFHLDQLVEEEIAAVKLAAMSIKIDTLTAEQRKYLASWESGT